MKSSITDIEEFKACCCKVVENDDLFDIFRKIEPIQTIIDGVDEKLAKMCLLFVRKKCPDL